MERLLGNVSSKYKLIILASRRTLELNEGKPKLTDAPLNMKLANIALKEIAEGKITYKLRKEEK